MTQMPFSHVYKKNQRPGSSALYQNLLLQKAQGCEPYNVLQRKSDQKCPHDKA